jgi:hypothetical protein
VEIKIPELIQQIPPGVREIRATFIQNYTFISNESFRLHRVHTTIHDEHLMTYSRWDPIRKMWWLQTSDGVYVWEAPPPVCNIEEAQAKVRDVLEKMGYMTIKFGSCVQRRDVGRGVFFVLFCDYPRRRFIVYEDGTVVEAKPHNHSKIE